MIKKMFILFVILVLLSSFSSYALQKEMIEQGKLHSSPSFQTINYLQPGISISRRLYIKALLESVMSTTEAEYGPYKINVVDSNLVPMRRRQEMIKGELVNLIWTTEYGNLNEGLIKIPFQTMKGILGYRALIIKAHRQGEFSKVTNLAQLRLMKPGQVKFWTDTHIYKINDFNVVTSPKMSVLFPMLESGRFDFLPLGASEISQEYLLIRQKYHSLAIETDLLLKYSLYMYLMVSPTEPTLAERLEKGLSMIDQNGEFDDIFNQFIQPEVDSIQMQKRRVIHLKSK